MQPCYCFFQGELVAKISTSLLRYTTHIPADKAFYEAGLYCKVVNKLNMAFLFWNRYFCSFCYCILSIVDNFLYFLLFVFLTCWEKPKCGSVKSIFATCHGFLVGIIEYLQNRTAWHKLSSQMQTLCLVVDMHHINYVSFRVTRKMR